MGKFQKYSSFLKNSKYNNNNNNNNNIWNNPVKLEYIWKNLSIFTN